MSCKKKAKNRNTPNEIHREIKSSRVPAARQFPSDTTTNLKEGIQKIPSHLIQDLRGSIQLLLDPIDQLCIHPTLPTRGSFTTLLQPSAVTVSEVGREEHH